MPRTTFATATAQTEFRKSNKAIARAVAVVPVEEAAQADHPVKETLVVAMLLPLVVATDVAVAAHAAPALEPRA